MRALAVAALSALAFDGHSALAQDNSGSSKPPLQEEIVSDETSQSLLPELSDDADELGEALEPIEAFERRFEAQTSAASPEADASDETEADSEKQDLQAPEEQFGAPGFTDPDLAQPLPPIEEFEALPLEFTQALNEDNTENAELRYRWGITGLAEADAQTSIDLEDQFEGLSALEQGDGKAANTAMLTARLADDKALLTRILRAEGWYLAEIDGRLRPGQPEDKAAAVASLNVEAGPRFTVSRIVIEAEPTVPDNLIDGAILLKPGDPVTASAIQLNEALIATTLPENGYPFATVGPRDIALDAETAGSV
ncbi:MAG: hypothetical protein AAFQ13_10330, partial [Pseudomonadota bacterium]